MGLTDFIVIAILAVITALVIRNVLKQRKAGVKSCGCGGGCGGCTGCGMPQGSDEIRD